MINKVILIGNLGKDPELTNTSGGHPVCRFSVATTRRWKDRDGVKQEETEWHNVVVWGKSGENAASYLSKGNKVYIEGRIKTDKYTDKTTGQDRYSTQIVAENWQNLTSKPLEPYAVSSQRKEEEADDDIPF